MYLKKFVSLFPLLTGPAFCWLSWAILITFSNSFFTMLVIILYYLTQSGNINIFDFCTQFVMYMVKSDDSECVSCMFIFYLIFFRFTLRDSQNFAFLKSHHFLTEKNSFLLRSINVMLQQHLNEQNWKTKK